MPAAAVPSFKSTAFNCPHCAAYSSQAWLQLHSFEVGFPEPTYYWCAECAACGDASIWEMDKEDVKNGRLIHPGGIAAARPHEDMPADVALDFDEAAAIAFVSPRGAAALLRLAVQKLMIALGMPGKNINDDIGQLVKEGLPAQIQQALDYCRVVGNNAVHPGEMDLQDSPELVGALFEMINMIVDYRISQPKRVQELFAKMPAGAIAAIDRRDGNKLG